MFYYAQCQEEVLFSRQPISCGQAMTEKEALKDCSRLIYLSDLPPGESKGVYCIHHPGLLFIQKEGSFCLEEKRLTKLAAQQGAHRLPEKIKELIALGSVKGVNQDYQDFIQQLHFVPESGRKKVHILAMGDVGSTLLIGLGLLGGDCIEEIGIYDFHLALSKRWEHELNQTAWPWEYDRLPAVRVLQEEELFHCDVFVFCASKGVPPVGGGVQDVRMAQLEANAAMIAHYGRLARQCHFTGLFAVVSDPVDPLCQRLFAASNQDEQGQWDFQGLRPEQIKGYGLGVMNSRAAYYAKQDARFAQFLKEGRAYGPHGQELVIADSIAHYDHALSLELTRLTVNANMEIRELGFKPYVAPALSSAAISLLLTLRGQWHYSSNFLGGIFMGAKNRQTLYGIEQEILPLPEPLYQRLEHAEAALRMFC